MALITGQCHMGVPAFWAFSLGTLSYHNATSTYTAPEPHRGCIDPRDLRDVHGFAVSQEDIFDAMLAANGPWIATEGAGAAYPTDSFDLWNLQDVIFPPGNRNARGWPHAVDPPEAHLRLALSMSRELSDEQVAAHARLHSAFQDIWGTLVHEMLHAYLAVSTDCEIREYWAALGRSGQDVDHSPGWAEACGLLARRLGFLAARHR
ncbi:hypothetical protein LTR85_004055 [Meristemomyces frigidus]|nr:hypothetical protein LTR85_004055 [Meristemomyces frigidus]